jgi:hypothetical protein
MERERNKKKSWAVDMIRRKLRDNFIKQISLWYHLAMSVTYMSAWTSPKELL